MYCLMGAGLHGENGLDPDLRYLNSYIKDRRSSPVWPRGSAAKEGADVKARKYIQEVSETVLVSSQLNGGSSHIYSPWYNPIFPI